MTRRARLFFAAATALDEAPPQTLEGRSPPARGAAAGTDPSEVNRAHVRDALGTVIDPEIGQSGLGIGAVTSRLALSRYGGPIVLIPSHPRYHYAWNAWLGRAGGWGCGSRQLNPSLVTLAAASPTTGVRE